jgi:hypothetical protein
METQRNRKGLSKLLKTDATADRERWREGS